MTRRRLTDILTVFLGVLYIVAGIAETTRAIVTGDGGIPFWFGSLVGGGALILVGTLAFRHRPRLCASLVTVGCLAGVLATIWTLVIPLIALAVVVLVVLRTSEDVDRLQTSPE
jgi:hypothetical protein